SLRCQRIQPINGDPSARPHFEILLSVKDDHGKIVSPQDFIQATEWYRRMTAVDRWVVEKAFTWMAGHRETLEKINAITINLSGQTLSDDSFIDFLLDQMTRTAVPPDKLCFEVTETVGVSNLSDAAGFIMEVKKTGCTFALDDFGSGMSSYAYLKNLPIDLIKIDGAFVKNIEHSSSDHAVVKSITEIGHFMNKKIVAEYVENDAILNLLREIGVDYAQGYAIAKPDLLDRLVVSN
ncbi:MAG: EAL domain-containing protein, partial [Gammaproteobacteria bacterium]|nr:EAL domain-containing protein [Gammaproteobacteria bacterium]